MLGFGTATARVEGLDDLIERQWRRVWPETDGFRFDLSAFQYQVSRDGCLAAIMAPWSSTGYDRDGSTFVRPGRATVVLTRASAGDPRKAVHTHLSLNPAAGS